MAWYIALVFPRDFSPGFFPSHFFAWTFFQDPLSRFSSSCSFELCFASLSRFKFHNAHFIIIFRLLCCNFVQFFTIIYVAMCVCVCACTLLSTFLLQFCDGKAEKGTGDCVSGVMLSYGSFVVCEKLFYERLSVSLFPCVRVFS